jgi:hypothetical protein
MTPPVADLDRAVTYRDDQGHLWHAVPTLTQCEKTHLNRSCCADGNTYTSYDRYLTRYRIDEPIQQVLL